MNFTNFCPFWGTFLPCDLLSYIFTIFFRGSEVSFERGDSYNNLGYLEKKYIFILREFCKKGTPKQFDSGGEIQI